MEDEEKIFGLQDKKLDYPAPDPLKEIALTIGKYLSVEVTLNEGIERRKRIDEQEREKRNK